MVVAVVESIQVNGGQVVYSLYEATRLYQEDDDSFKLNFAIRLPNGELKTITFRREDNRTVVYGNMKDLT